MVWPILADSILPGRNFLLQIFKPVQHDVDLCRGRLLLPDGLDHQETLAVRRYVVVGDSEHGRQVVSLKEHPGLACTETRLSGDLHGHHLVTAAVEQLPSVRVPYWLSATFDRDLPLAAGARVGLNVNLIAAGFIRGIGQPAPIVGKPWCTFVEPCSQEGLRLAVA